MDQYESILGALAVMFVPIITFLIITWIFFPVTEAELRREQRGEQRRGRALKFGTRVRVIKPGFWKGQKGTLTSHRKYRKEYPSFGVTEKYPEGYFIRIDGTDLEVFFEPDEILAYLKPEESNGQEPKNNI